MKRNVDDFFIYDKIGKQFYSDKKFLNKELLINTSFNVVDESKNIVEQIYKHCFEEAFYFSWSSNQSYIKPNDFKINNDEVEYEEAIFNHCVISTMYTVQYLLYKDVFIKPSELGNIIECNGLNYLTNPGKNQKIKVNEDYKEVEFLINGIENDRNTIIKKQLKVLTENDNNYIGRTLGTDKSNISLFLSNFSYLILENSDLFNAYKLIEDVNKSNNTREINRNIKIFLTSYINAVNEISLTKCDDFGHTDNIDNIDKIMFYYKKERLLHSDYIRFSVNKCGRDLYINNTDEEIIKKCILLPNVFSRNLFAERFSRNSSYEESYYFSINSLDNLLNITLPIFEKVFFITLFNYCTKCSKQSKLKKRLEFMNTLLKNYIEDKICKEEVFNNLLATFNSNCNMYLTKQAEEIREFVDIKACKEDVRSGKDKLKRADNETIENRANIYKLLKYAIEDNKNQLNNDNIPLYNDPSVDIPYHIGMLKKEKKEKEKERSNYLKQEISKDYSLYINCINSKELNIKNNIVEIMQISRTCRNEGIITDKELFDDYLKNHSEKLNKMIEETEKYYKKIYNSNFMKNRNSIFDDFIKGKEGGNNGK